MGDQSLTGNDREYHETDQLIPLRIENNLQPARKAGENTFSRLVFSSVLLSLLYPDQLVSAQFLECRPEPQWFPDGRNTGNAYTFVQF